MRKPSFLPKSSTLPASLIPKGGALCYRSSFLLSTLPTTPPDDLEVWGLWLNVNVLMMFDTRAFASETHWFCCRLGLGRRNALDVTGQSVLVFFSAY